MFAYRYFKEDNLLAVCDRELLGKKLKSRDVEIEIKKSFYFEKFGDETELIKLLKEAKIINLFGRKIFELAKKENIFNGEVKEVGGIVHLQIYKI